MSLPNQHGEQPPGRVPPVLSFVAGGPYTVDTQVDGRRYNRSEAPWVILDVTLYREVAGISGSTTIDLNIDGTTAYTTQANRPTIGFAEGDDAVDRGAALPDILSIPVGSYLSVDTDAVEAGAQNYIVAVTVRS